MKIIIPMAGTGNRFVQQGYTDPKPMIKINGKMIIEYILDMFDCINDEFVFICNNTHILNTNIQEILLSLVKHGTVISIPEHKLGPVYTVQQAYDYIVDDEEVIVSYCDNPYRWNRQDFNQKMILGKYDGCVLTHTGFHPHTLATTKMAFVKGIDGNLIEIKEKACYTDNPMNEHASTGVYYFKRGKDIKKYFDLAIQTNLQYNGEYYVTLVYNLLVKYGLTVGYYDTPFVTVFGTPEEVETFNGWQNIIKGGQIKNEEDLVKCYRYWKLYHEGTKNV